MKKQLLLLGALAVVMSASAADSEIISETPAGDLHPTVYGVSQRTYLISNGGFGSFENPGYTTSMVVDGSDIYVRNMIREYAGMDSWVKGTVVSDGLVEFQFPQPVVMTGGETYYASMMVPVDAEGGVVNLVPAEDDNVLRMSWNGSELVQIMPETASSSQYNGLIGLVDAAGSFKSYGETGVSYKIWDEQPAAPSSDVQLKDYTATYMTQWNDLRMRRMQVGIDGTDAWIQGLNQEIPEAWVKGTVAADGSITLPSGQFMGIVYDYFTFFYGADNQGIQAGKEYKWTDEAVLTPTEDGYAAAGAMMINLGNTRPWFGFGIAEFELKEIVPGSQTPSDPIIVDPWQYTEEDGAGIVDFILMPEDTDGQALNINNLYYRVYFDGELQTFLPDDYFIDEPMTDIPASYNNDFTFINLPEDGYTMVLFFRPLEKVGIQAVYKVDGVETVSGISEYTFVSDGCGDAEISRAEVVATDYFTLTGIRVENPSGLCIKRVTRADGSVEAHKVNVVR